jgi:hypothetical protein
MRELEPVKPSVDLPMSMAAQELTGFEILAVEKRYRASFADLGPIKLLIGTVWAYANRDGQQRAWPDVEAMTMRELSGFFEPEPEDMTEDSDAGKDE